LLDFITVNFNVFL